MHFFTATLAIGACLFSAGVAAQGPQFTDWPAELHPGKPATVRWSGGASGPLEITLLKGKSTDLKTVDTITAEVDGEKDAFTWVPKDSLVDGSDYALALAQLGIKNYSGHISLSHSENKIPPSKGPDPSRHNSTIPASETGVKKGNTRPDGKANKLADNELLSGKAAAMSGEQLTGGGAFNTVPVRLALGTVAAIFFLTT